MLIKGYMRKQMERTYDIVFNIINKIRLVEKYSNEFIIHFELVDDGPYSSISCSYNTPSSTLTPHSIGISLSDCTVYSSNLKELDLARDTIYKSLGKIWTTTFLTNDNTINVKFSNKEEKSPGNTEESDFIDELVNANVSILEDEINNSNEEIEKIKDFMIEAAKKGYTSINIRFTDKRYKTSMAPSDTDYFYYLTITYLSSLKSVKENVIEYFSKLNLDLHILETQINLSWKKQALNKLKEKGLLKEEE